MIKLFLHLRHSLFIILDEIYNMTVFDSLEDGSEFKSCLNIIDEDPGYDRSKVIWMWGLSKIFSIPGLRVAAIFSWNDRILESTKRSLMYNGLNVLTQHVVQEILNDHGMLLNKHVYGLYYTRTKI